MASRKILGVDPGSRNTGYAILLEEGRSYRALECDTIRMSGDEDQVSRLRKIYRELTTIISRHQPDFCAVESPVYGDRKSTRLNSSHVAISYAVFCLKKKKNDTKRHK